MADGVVQLAPDGSGKKVDTSEIARPADSVLVERQRIINADNTFFGNVQSVLGDGAAIVKQPKSEELLFLILQELRILTMITVEGMNLHRSYDLDNIRNSQGGYTDPEVAPLT
jgi:hypothetical protein